MPSRPVARKQNRGAPRTLWLLGVCLGVCLIAGAAYGQDVVDAPDVSASDAQVEAPAGKPELIQSIENEKLGQLSLPGFWDVSDVADGIRAIETRSQRPASIEVASLAMPGSVSATAIAEAMVAEMKSADDSVVVLEQGPVKDTEGLDQVYVELRVTESQTPTRYGFIVVAGDRASVIVTLAAPDERFDAFESRVLLAEILASIR